MSVPVWHEVYDIQLRSMNWDQRKQRVKSMKKWCQENAGTDGIFWRTDVDLYPRKALWLFRDPCTAMMFRMVWMCSLVDTVVDHAIIRV